jgi:hypothetical protein
MLGDGLGELELLTAFLATVLVGGHGSKSSNGGDAYRILQPTADLEKFI